VFVIQYGNEHYHSLSHVTRSTEPLLVIIVVIIGVTHRIGAIAICNRQGHRGPGAGPNFADASQPKGLSALCRNSKVWAFEKGH